MFKNIINSLFLYVVTSGVVFAASQPVVNNTSPSENFIGEGFCFVSEFSNASADVGYGPYYQLILNPDLSFDSADFNGLGVTVVSNQTFPAGGVLVDPVSGQNVNGPAGGQLVILEIPVGSVSNTQAALPVEVCLDVSNTATENALISNAITLVPGFQFGDSATGTVGVDTIVGSPDPNDFTPTIINYTIMDTVAEGENPPGPAWTYPIMATADIASDRTVSPITFPPITLPGNVKYDGNLVITGGVGCTISPSEADLLANTGNGTDVTINLSCTSGTGTLGSSEDIKVSFDVYIVDTLDNMTCNTEGAINTAKHLVLRKNVSGMTRPGETLTYTYSYQTSEFIPGINQFTVTDLLSDGISYLDAGGSQVALNISHNGGATVTTINVPFSPSGSDSTFTADIYNAIVTVGGSIGPAESGIITYQAIIDQSYNNSDPVLTRDTINNDVDVIYGVSGAGNAQNCPEDSSAFITIDDVAITKSVIGSSTVLPGEVIQFQLSMDIPSGDANGVIFTDVLPLPVFDATAFPAFTGDLNSYPGSAVAGNFIEYAAGSFQPASVSVSSVGSSNSVIIDFGDISSPTSETITINLYALASTEPYGDGLSIANLLSATTNNTTVDNSSNNTGTQILVGAPDVGILKEIISPLTPPDAGDTIDYRITLTNSGRAPAYDVTVTDILAPELDSATCTTPVIAGGSGSYTGSLTTNIVLDNTLPTGGGLSRAADGNNVAVITYSCDIDISVGQNTLIENTAKMVFASAAGATSFPEKESTASITTTQPSVSKSVVTTSEPYTVTLGSGREELAVGEIARFRIEVELPEGTFGTTSGNTSARIIDLLPSRLQYLNDGTSEIAFVSAGSNITASNYTSPGGCTLHSTSQAVVPDCPISPIIPGDGSFDPGDDPVFNLGQVINNASDANSEFIVLEFNAIAIDVSPGNYNNRGRFRENNTNITSPNTQLSQVDPVLELDKQSSVTTGDAGDIIDYTLVISAPNSSPYSGYDISLNDILPAGLVYVSASGSYGACSGANPAFDDSDPNDSGINITMDSLAPGDSCTFTYQASLDVNAMPSSTYTNTATLEWTSLQASGTDVTGTPLEGSSHGTEATFNVADSVSVMVTGTAPVKSIVSTNQSHTSEAPDPRPLSIGETVRYRMEVVVPEGTANSFVIRDNLPDGLEYVANTARVALVSNGGLSSSAVTTCSSGSLNYAPPSSGVTPDCPIAPTLGASGNSVDFNFGDVTNAISADGTVETIVVEFDAITLNQLSNQEGVSLSNSFEVLLAGTQDSLSTNVDAIVVEPQLVFTASTATPDPVDNRINTTPTVAWTLTLANQGQAQAFQIQDGDSGNWQIQLPTGVENITGLSVNTSGTVVQNGDLVTPISISDFSVSGVDNSLLTLNNIFSMSSGASITITFNSTLDPSVSPGSTLSGSTDVDYASQQSGASANEVREFADISTGTGNDPINDAAAPLNNYRTETALTVDTIASVPVIGVAKELISSTFVPSDGSFNVVYRFYIENTGDVHLEDVQVTDDLAAAFNPNATYSVTSLTAAITSGTGTIDANDSSFNGASDTDLLVAANSSLEVSATATIDLTINVQPGSNLGTYNNNADAEGTSVRDATNTATDDSLNGSDPDPEGDGPNDNTSDTPVTFAVNPAINIAKQINGAVTNNGDGTYTVNYQMVVKNTGDVDLNDVQVADDLSTTFSAASSFSVGAGSPTSGDLTVNSSYDGSSDTNLLAASQSLAVGATATINLQVIVTPGLSLGPYNNTAVASATSPNGNPANDDSDDGTDPETDNGSGGTDDPTPVTFTEAPSIGVA
ncbi:MAG: hypothetical protein CMP47_00730, partial [Rickettsiales bacterium]|nr:hypothetical protein [Rickettsiales bacterium]